MIVTLFSFFRKTGHLQAYQPNAHGVCPPVQINFFLPARPPSEVAPAFALRRTEQKARWCNHCSSGLKSIIIKILPATMSAMAIYLR